MCKYFVRGHCKQGDRCAFSHALAAVPVAKGVDDDKADISRAGDGIAAASATEDPASTPCKYFARGRCKLGDRCTYMHVAAAAAAAAAVAADAAFSNRSDATEEVSGTLCKYFAKGYCRLGSECPYVHKARDYEKDTYRKASEWGVAYDVAEQAGYGAQSCRGLASSPDLSPLGGDTHAVRVFKQMLAREYAMAGDWVAFYHSYNSSAMVYEVQASIARVLFKFGAKHGSLPRLLKKPFEKVPDAPAMLKAFPTWPDQDHNPAFKAVGICATTSLVSLDPEATPTQVFLAGYAASLVNIKVLEKLLMDCGAGIKRKQSVPSLATKVVDLAKKHGLPQATGSSGRTGHMLQIFVRRSCVDRCAYASHPMGVPDNTRQPLSKALCSSGIIVGQARVVVNPSAFMRASQVRLYASSADETFHYNRPAFQQELVDLLDPILGSPEVREAAVKGIYGGKLPSWWKDVAAEGAEADDVASST